MSYSFILFDHRFFIMFFLLFSLLVSIFSLQATEVVSPHVSPMASPVGSPLAERSLLSDIIKKSSQRKKTHRIVSPQLALNFKRELFSGSAEIACEMIRIGQINVFDMIGKELVFEVCINMDKFDVVKFLINQSYINPDTLTQDGKTLDAYAGYHGTSPEMRKYLFEKRMSCGY